MAKRRKSVAELEAQVDDLQEQVEDLEGENDDLQSTLDEIVGIASGEEEVKEEGDGEPGE